MDPSDSDSTYATSNSDADLSSSSGFSHFERKWESQLHPNESSNSCATSDDSEGNEAFGSEVQRQFQMNSQLRQTQRLLLQKIKALKLEASRNDALWCTLNRSLRRPMPNLPAELLLHIMELTIPPPFLLNSHRSLGLRSSWCMAQQSKIILTLVCKAWYNPGLSLLLRHITIRDFSQLERLIATLENPAGTAKFGEMIHHVDLECLTQDSECCTSSAFKRLTERLQSLAPNISSLGLKGAAFSFDNISHTSPIPITHLEVSRNLVPPLPYRAEHIFWVVNAISTTLRALTIVLPSTSLTSGTVQLTTDGPVSPKIHVQFADQIYLPQLESLNIGTDDLRVNLHTFFNAFNLWEMPNLTRLTYPAYIVGFSTGYHDFFSAHGSTIRVLELDTPYEQRNEISDSTAPSTFESGLQQVLDLCPNLQHLIVDIPRFAEDTDTALSHPNLKYLDIWQYQWFPRMRRDISLLLPERPIWGRHILFPRPPSTNRMDEDDNEDDANESYSYYMDSNLPSLKAVRQIDKALRHLRDIPIHLPPDCVLTDDESFNIIYCGINLRHEPGLLFQVEDGYDEYVKMYPSEIQYSDMESESETETSSQGST